MCNFHGPLEQQQNFLLVTKQADGDWPSEIEMTKLLSCDYRFKGLPFSAVVKLTCVHGDGLPTR